MLRQCLASTIAKGGPDAIKASYQRVQSDLKERRGGFPPGIKLGPNTRAWTAESIEHWLDTRPVAADHNAKAA